MKIRELLNNRDFDVNCNYAIYDCPKEGQYWGTGTRVFTTTKDCIVPDDVLEKEIKYITEHNHFLIMEVK